jgi:hypothetical protein
MNYHTHDEASQPQGNCKEVVLKFPQHLYLNSKVVEQMTLRMSSMKFFVLLLKGGNNIF